MNDDQQSMSLRLLRGAILISPSLVVVADLVEFYFADAPNGNPGTFIWSAGGIISVS